MAGSTTRLSLYKPGGGSTGLYLPDETADIDRLNENFDKLDDAAGAKGVTSTTRPPAPFDGQIIKESDTGRAMVWQASITTWVELAPGSIVAGSTALRDLIFPVPATPAARVSLANQIPRWFNTDKGWEEQYFSQFDDAGALVRNSAQTHGWKAIGNHLVHATSLVPAVGTAVDRGDRVLLSGCSAVELRGIVTDDYDDYQIVFKGTGSATASVTLRTMAGAVLETGAAAYGRNRLTIDNASVVGAYNTDSFGILGEVGTVVASVVRATVYGPKLLKHTDWVADSHNSSTGRQMRCSGQLGTATSYDGLWIGGGGTNLSGDLQIFGIGR